MTFPIDNSAEWFAFCLISDVLNYHKFLSNLEYVIETGICFVIQLKNFLNFNNKIKIFYTL